MYRINFYKDVLFIILSIMSAKLADLFEFCNFIVNS